MSLDRDAPIARPVEPKACRRIVALPRVSGLKIATRGQPDHFFATTGQSAEVRAEQPNVVEDRTWLKFGGAGGETFSLVSRSLESV